MVQYPNVLSAQVLPKNLKALAVKRLLNAKNNVKKYKLVHAYPELLDFTIGQIDSNINFLLSKHRDILWPDCVEFNRRLDQTRNQSFLDITPEFKDYV